MQRTIWLEVSVVDPVPRTKVLDIQGKRHNILSPRERVRPSQHPLRVVLVVTDKRVIGTKVVNLLVPQVRKEIIRTEDRNLSRIVIPRIVSRIPAEVVHHILVLLRVVVGQDPTFLGIVTLVANLVINHMIVRSNHLQDLGLL